MGRAAQNPVTGLTAKEAEFAFQTVRLGDHNKAYRMAYDATGMQPGSVRACVTRLVRKQRVLDRINELQAVADAKLEVTIERIAKEAARIAFVDFGELFDEQGRPIPIHLLPKDVRHAVQSVIVVEKRGGLAVELKKGEGEKDAKKKQGAAEAKADVEAEADVAGIHFVPMRERKVSLHGKMDALQLLARWKKMIHERGEQGEDPGDIRNLTDEALEAELKASKAALEMIDRARKRKGTSQPQKT